MGAIAASALGGLFSLGGSLASGRSQRRAQEAARAQQLAAIEEGSEVRNRLIGELLRGDFRGLGAGPQDVFGRRVEETDLSESQLKAALSNLQNLSTIERLVSLVNAGISEDALTKAADFDPNFQQNISALSDQARQFLRGEIPEDVFDFRVRDRAGRTSRVGVPGTAGPATSRDLGLTSLDLQERGLSVFQALNNIREQVDPITRRLISTQFLVDPSAQLAVDQANARLRAQPDPTAAGLFGIDLQGAVMDALARGQVAVPVSNTAGNLLTGLGGAFGGLQTAISNQQLLDVLSRQSAFPPAPSLPPLRPLE
jgi:hypothetical protein